MPKGIFTQGLCVLLDHPVTLDLVTEALADFEIVKRVEAGPDWQFSGPSLIIAYLPESNGYVSIDLVDQPWPDHMGDPQKEATLFGSWSMGFFGPFTYPGGLLRASEQCWTWTEGRTATENHKAYIRIRSSYTFGESKASPVIPADYAAIPELEFLSNLALALLTLPGAICYFNPGGEVLLDESHLEETLAYGKEHELPPIDAWSNVRLFRFDDQWSMMDSVGNGQWDTLDAEACFETESYDPGEIANFLRNVSLYLLQHGDVVEHGDTMDGPGDIRWQAHRCEKSICDPPRFTLRWFPQDQSEIPVELLATVAEDESPEELP